MKPKMVVVVVGPSLLFPFSNVRYDKRSIFWGVLPFPTKKERTGKVLSQGPKNGVFGKPREAPVRFGYGWGWNGSSGSGFRFRRFLCKKGFFNFFGVSVEFNRKGRFRFRFLENPKGANLEKFQDLEIFKRAWIFQVSHPPNPLFFCGEFWRSGLKFSSEIEIFKRDWNFKRSWFFSRFRPLGNGSGSSGSAFGFGKNGSDGSGFRFRFGSWATPALVDSKVI